jgi:N-acetylneuraminic acid mutarotase
MKKYILSNFSFSLVLPVILIGLFSIMPSCSGGVGVDGGSTAVHNQWTWMSGANTVNQTGTYGTKGTPAAANIPGARAGAVSWIDGSGNLWLFGGYGRDSAGTGGELNDLWKYDGSNWTWMSGANTINQAGTYGTKATPAAANVPGARETAVSWIDGSGNLWLFGGYGYDSAGTFGHLNDLWKFDGSNWTWMSGANTVNQMGTYGTKATPAAANVPGARYSSASWIDGSGNLWLFGGFGYDSTGNVNELNDLWKFDGSNWAWMSGANTVNQTGTYGTKGTPAVPNVPGARQPAASWIDGSGNLWLFGGLGYDSGTLGAFSDLWKFDGSNWTWMSGANTLNQTGTYGTKGTPAVPNVPGARYSAVSWINQNGLWLFGGSGNDSAGTGGNLNDLWKFDGSNWTWMSGANTVYETGTYGTKGVASAVNVPGARSVAISWTDKSGNLWLFGGFGYDSTSTVSGHLNDLWRYQP